MSLSDNKLFYTNTNYNDASNTLINYNNLTGNSESLEHPLSKYARGLFFSPNYNKEFFDAINWANNLGQYNNQNNPLLSNVLINRYLVPSNYTDISGLVAVYLQGDWDIVNNVWPDRSDSSSVYDAVLSATVGFQATSLLGNGSPINVTALKGGPTNSISFGNVLSNNYTVCSIARKTDTSSPDQIISDGVSWAHGSGGGDLLINGVEQPLPINGYRYWGVRAHPSAIFNNGSYGGAYNVMWVTFNDADDNILNVDATFFKYYNNAQSGGALQFRNHTIIDPPYGEITIINDSGHTYDTANRMFGQSNPNPTPNSPLLFVDLLEPKDVRKVIHYAGGSYLSKLNVVASNDLVIWDLIETDYDSSYHVQTWAYRHDILLTPPSPITSRPLPPTDPPPISGYRYWGWRAAPDATWPNGYYAVQWATFHDANGDVLNVDANYYITSTTGVVNASSRSFLNYKITPTGYDPYSVIIHGPNGANFNTVASGGDPNGPYIHIDLGEENHPTKLIHHGLAGHYFSNTLVVASNDLVTWTVIPQSSQVSTYNPSATYRTEVEIAPPPPPPVEDINNWVVTCETGETIVNAPLHLNSSNYSGSNFEIVELAVWDRKLNGYELQSVSNYMMYDVLGIPPPPPYADHTYFGIAPTSSTSHGWWCVVSWLIEQNGVNIFDGSNLASSQLELHALTNSISGYNITPHYTGTDYNCWSNPGIDADHQSQEQQDYDLLWNAADDDAVDNKPVFYVQATTVLDGSPFTSTIVQHDPRNDGLSSWPATGKIVSSADGVKWTVRSEWTTEQHTLNNTFQDNKYSVPHSITNSNVYIDSTGKDDRMAQPNSLAISRDGKRVAVGASYYGTDVTGYEGTSWGNDGMVRVFEWINNNWTQIGNSIIDDFPEPNSPRKEKLGQSVSLNSDGTRLILGGRGGRPPDADTYQQIRGWAQAYELNGSTWVKMGQFINGIAKHDEFSYSMDMNDDGTIIAIGAYRRAIGGLDKAGQIRVFKYNSTTQLWFQLGQNIDGDAFECETGTTLALNHDGTWLVSGEPNGNRSDANNWRTSRGQVRIFQLDPNVAPVYWETQNPQWIQRGNTISGFDNVVYNDGKGSLTGASVSLSNHNGVGLRVAYGSSEYWPESDGGLWGCGAITVVEWNGTSWINIGSKIIGEREHKIGKQVSITSDGNRIVTLSGYFQHGTTKGGYIYIYDWNGTEWVNIISTGYSYSMSLSVGDIMANHALSISANSKVVVVGESNYYYETWGNGGIPIDGRVARYDISGGWVTAKSLVWSHSDGWVAATD